MPTAFPEYTFTEQDEVIRSFGLFGEILDIVFPGSEAPIIMTALKRVVAHGRRDDWVWTNLDEKPLDTDWRKTWSEIDGWDDTCDPPFLDELHDLNAFANFGVVPIWGRAGDPRLNEPSEASLAARVKAAGEDVPAYIEGICTKIDRLEALLPRQEGATP